MFHLNHFQRSISVAGSQKHNNRCRGSSFQEEIIQHICVYCIRQQSSSIQKNHLPMSSFHLDFKGPIQNLCHASLNTLPDSPLRIKNHNFYLLFLRMTGKRGKQLGLFLIYSLLQNNVTFFWFSWVLPRQNIHSFDLLNSLSFGACSALGADLHCPNSTFKFAGSTTTKLLALPLSLLPPGIVPNLTVSQGTLSLNIST